MMWLQEFRLIFGSSTPATAAVLAIFMGGLGLGAAWFVQRVARDLAAYLRHADKTFEEAAK